MFCHPSIYIPTYIHILCYSFDFTKLHIIIYSILFFCGFANMHCKPDKEKGFTTPGALQIHSKEKVSQRLPHRETFVSHYILLCLTVQEDSISCCPNSILATIYCGLSLRQSGYFVCSTYLFLRFSEVATFFAYILLTTLYNFFSTFCNLSSNGN